jgi:hypothetical protein
VNIGAHIAVAARLHRRIQGAAPPDPGELLGAALPDLAAMGRFRLLGRTAHAGAARGIRLHHRSDAAFHGHPWFHQRQGDLRADLTHLGFDRGPAMACGHVGVELLLDGALMVAPAVADAVGTTFDLIPHVGPDLAPLVEPSRQSHWLSHLDRFAGRPPLNNLDDPEEVAHRLFRILSSRPRLAFPRHQVPQLVGALDRQRPAVVGSGSELVDDLVERLMVEPLPVGPVSRCA